MSTTLGLKIVFSGVGFGALAASFGSISTRVNNLGAASQKTQARIKALGLETVDAFKKQKEATEKASNELKEHARTLTAMGRAQAQAKALQTESTQALEAYRTELAKLDGKPTEEQRQQIHLLRLQASQAEKDFKKLNGEFETARKKNEGLTEKVQAHTQKLHKLRDELSANGIKIKSTTGLSDGLSAARLRITRQLEKEQQALANLTRRYERLNAVQRDVTTSRAELADRKTNLLAAASIGASLVAPVVMTAKFEDQIKQISITGELYKTPGAEAALSQKVRQAALKHGVSHGDVAEGVGTLVTQGMDGTQAGGYADMLAYTKKATRTDTNDLAKLTYTLQDKYHRKSEEEVFEAFNALHRAGKMGKYEMRRMAQAFPSLGGTAASFGSTNLEGVKEMGAMMQVMRASAGDDSEAETYMSNWFSHMSANATQEHFASVGIDFEKAKLSKVQEGAGKVSNIEASFMVFDDYINKVVESGQVVSYKKNGKVKSSIDMKAELAEAMAAAKKDGLQGQALTNYMQSAIQRVGLSSVLQDMQATQAYLAWTSGKDRYREIRAELDKPETAQTIANDAKQQDETTVQKWGNLKASLAELGITIGTVLSPAVGELLDKLNSMAKWLNEFAQENPNVAKYGVLAVAGLAALVSTLLALGVAASVARLGLAGFRSLPYLGRIAGSPGTITKWWDKAKSGVKSKIAKPTLPWKKGGGGGGGGSGGSSGGGGAGRFAAMRQSASRLAGRSVSAAVTSGGLLSKIKPAGAVAGKFAGKAVVPLAVGMALFSAGSALADDKLSAAAKGTAVGGAAGSLAGGLAGAKLGALVGTAILPGVGTVVGGLLGGAAGGVAGDWMGGKLGGKLAGADQSKAPPTPAVAANKRNTPVLPAPAKPPSAVAALKSASVKSPAPIEIKMEYKPQITIHGDPTPHNQQRFKEMLQSHQQTLEMMFKRMLAEQQRRAY